MVLSEWFITWMEQYKKNRVKSGTYYNYKKYFDSMIKGRQGDKKIRIYEANIFSGSTMNWRRKDMRFPVSKLCLLSLMGVCSRL